ncbi:MAG TPA: hypothetical protein DHV60_07970 [Verrucomicrobiales bacterium]|nr:hypothetical protein [Verrucomicrobiales bacterium]
MRYDQAGTIIGAILIMTLTLGWLRYSRRGLEVRAMMQNAEGAAYSGISRQATALPVLMLTGALAGMAAALLSQTIFVSPTAGVIPLIKGLTIALLGGLGSVPGALIGAVLVGFLEAGVTKKPRGTNGFGYDSIFENKGKTLAELSSEEKNSISHRKIATNKMIGILNEKI